MFKIRVFIDGHAGFFVYEVSTLDQAMNHFAAITSTGYRRINDRGYLVWYSPALIRSIAIIPPEEQKSVLSTNYPDQFQRT